MEFVMLGDEALKYLSSLVYDPDAKRRGSIIPLGGIYWEDEIPDFRKLTREMGRDAMKEVYRVFRIRFRIWKEMQITEDDQVFWDAVQELVPECPIFRRLELTEADRTAQKFVEDELVDMMEGFADSSTEAKIDQEGRFSFKLAPDKEKPSV
jgi:hypothetical protein